MRPALTGDFSGDLLALRGAAILGVNPPVFDFAFFDLWAKPLGLLYLLEALRERGNAVALLDCLYEAPLRERSFGRRIPQSRIVAKPAPYAAVPRHYRHFGLSDEAFAGHLRSMRRPDVILVTSAMTYWYPGVFWAIERLRVRFPGVPIYLGGIYARLCPDHAARCGAHFIQTEFFPVPASRPALDLYDSPRYGLAMTSFGCPFHCSYCASSRLWPRWRRRPVGEVVDEIAFQLALPGVESVAFYDDALLMDKEEHFYPLCRALERFPAVTFHTPNGLHVREIDGPCAAVLRRAGFRTLRLSFEGLDAVVDRAGSAKVSTDDFEAALAHLRRAGYGGDELETYLLLGLPGQEVEAVRRSIGYVRSLGAKVKLAEFSPIPGTPLFDEACRLVPELAVEPLLQNNSVYAPYVAASISPEELQSLKDLARGRSSCR